MFERVKKLFTDNRVRDLLSGNMVVDEDVLNDFIRQRGLPPGLTRLVIHCGDGEASVKAEGSVEGVGFKASGSARLLGVRITAAEQVVKLMPTGRAEVKTTNVESSVTFTPGPGLLAEAAAFFKLLPPGLAPGVVIGPDAIELSLHRFPAWSRDFAARIREIPLARELHLNLLDFVEIQDIRIEPGRVRILARRK